MFVVSCDQPRVSWTLQASSQVDVDKWLSLCGPRSLDDSSQVAVLQAVAATASSSSSSGDTAQAIAGSAVIVPI